MENVREVKGWSIRNGAPSHAGGGFYPFLRFDPETMMAMAPTEKWMHFSREEFVPSEEASTFEAAVEKMKGWLIR